MKKRLSPLLLMFCLIISACDESSTPITYQLRLSATKGSVGNTTFVRIYYKVGEISSTINNTTNNFSYNQEITANTRIFFTVGANINNAPSIPTASTTLKVIKIQGSKETEICNVSRTEVQGALTNYGTNHGIYQDFNGTNCTTVTFEKN